MSNLKAKELLAEKFNNYMNREIEMSEGEFTEQDDTTVVGSIYNKVFKNEIQMNNLEKKYINENKEIDIKKATKRKKELAAEISRVQKQLKAKRVSRCESSGSVLFILSFGDFFGLWHINSY